MTEGDLFIRVRTKEGITTVHSLNASSSFADLKASIAAATGLDAGCLKILVGYPPRPLACDWNETILMLLDSKRELLTVEEDAWVLI